jgi:chaperonin GroES
MIVVALPKVPFAPLGDNVLLEPILVKETPGGIQLPDSSQAEGPNKARVIAVGPGRLNEQGERLPMPVAAGDVVYATFVLGGSRYAPMKVTLNGRDYFVLSAGSLLGKVPAAD